MEVSNIGAAVMTVCPNESDSSPEEDARSLSPEEIIISSDEEENERSQPQEPVESDVSVDSDDMELLEETSSSSLFRV